MFLRLLFLLLGPVTLLAQQRPSPAQLRPFRQADRWGYLDSTGAVRLAPRFRAAGEFSEELAAVRETGQYGFVDGSGGWALPARYDYATAFSQGRALVWVAGKPLLIDRAGHNVLPPQAAHVERLHRPQQPDYFRVTTAAGRQGLLSATGQWLVDTLYQRVGPLRQGRAVVSRFHSEDIYQPEAVGVVNGKGELLVPYGRFAHMADFSDGFATVAFQGHFGRKSTHNRQGIIDSMGRLVATLPYRQFRFEEGDEEFRDGVVVVGVYNSLTAELHPDYYGAVNSQGKLLFQRPDILALTSFSNGRAFAKTSEGWYLIDKRGQFLNSPPYDDVVGLNHLDWRTPVFVGGRQFVGLANQLYTLMDSSGHAAASQRNLDAEPNQSLEPSAAAGPLLLLRQLADENQEPAAPCYGFWNALTNQLATPNFSDIDAAGFRAGLLRVVQDGRLLYLTRAGRVAWQQDTSAATVLDTDFMERSHYAAASPALPKYNGYGGWGTFGNEAKKVPAGRFAAGQVQVLLEAQPQPGLYAGRYTGRKLYLANTTADTAVFEAQDSHLYMQLQARDGQGMWQDIEYIAGSSCGNSDHELFLAPGQYWGFTVPAYAGGQPTRFRVKLTIRHGQVPGKDDVRYSNEVAGSVNPAQFWRRRGHSRSGIMDPYLD